MAVVSRATLYGWFETGDKPIEAQYADWIDSYWHINDTIPQASIEDLGPETVVVSGTGTTTTDAGKMIDDVVIIVGISGSVKVGTTVGGGQIIDEILPIGNHVYTLKLYYTGSTILYLTGNFTIKIYRK